MLSRLLLMILLTGLLNTTLAQTTEQDLLKVIAQLDQALLKKDTAALDRLLDKQVSFAHSNGWLQSKKDMLNDFASGKLHYGSLQTDSIEFRAVSKELATVTMKVKAGGRVGEKEFNLKLAVMQVWKKDKKGWQLFARQSAKLENN